MPTYEYACTACGHRLEAVQSFTDDPLTVCPDCKGALRKVYGAVGISFKGSGFYKNDSRKESNGRRTPATAESTSATSSESGSSSGSDSSSSSDSKTESTKTESTKTESPKTESTKAKTDSAKASTAS
jgi:putative FmdB family regulatory protein